MYLSVLARPSPGCGIPPLSYSSTYVVVVRRRVSGFLYILFASYLQQQWTYR